MYCLFYVLFHYLLDLFQHLCSNTWCRTTTNQLSRTKTMHTFNTGNLTPRQGLYRVKQLAQILYLHTILLWETFCVFKVVFPFNIRSKVDRALLDAIFAAMQPLNSAQSRPWFWRHAGLSRSHSCLHDQSCIMNLFSSFSSYSFSSYLIYFVEKEHANYQVPKACFLRPKSVEFTRGNAFSTCQRRQLRWGTFSYFINCEFY